MKIGHNTYFDDAVQSVGFVEGDKTNMTVGLVLPGDYDFGKAGPKETLTVTTGVINFNGVDYTPGGDSCVIETGQEIKASCKEPSSYVCVYG